MRSRGFFGTAVLAATALALIRPGPAMALAPTPQPVSPAAGAQFEQGSVLAFVADPGGIDPSNGETEILVTTSPNVDSGNCLTTQGVSAQTAPGNGSPEEPDPSLAYAQINSAWLPGGPGGTGQYYWQPRNSNPFPTTPPVACGPVRSFSVVSPPPPPPPPPPPATTVPQSVAPADHAVIPSRGRPNAGVVHYKWTSNGRHDHIALYNVTFRPNTADLNTGRSWTISYPQVASVRQKSERINTTGTYEWRVISDGVKGPLRRFRVVQTGPLHYLDIRIDNHRAWAAIRFWNNLGEVMDLTIRSRGRRVLYDGGKDADSGRVSFDRVTALGAEPQLATPTFFISTRMLERPRAGAVPRER